MRVLVAGARGFVGSALCPALAGAGHDVLRGVRPAFDVDDEPKVRAALEGQQAAFWLVHGLRRRGAYDAWERDVAHRFGRLAREAGVQRIVYLGGMEPRGRASKHMQSRLQTGEILRSSGVDVVELRAGIIVGAGSESWFLARDMAARLPAMLSPPWLASRQQPVGLDDVVAALVAALAVPAGIYDVPGPEIMTGEEVVRRTAHLLGRRARVVRVPFLPRRIAAAFAPLVTRSDRVVSKELLRGAGMDYLANDDGIFRLMPHHERLSFDDAAARALVLDDVSLAGQLYEGLLRVLERRS